MTGIFSFQFLEKKKEPISHPIKRKQIGHIAYFARVYLFQKSMKTTVTGNICYYKQTDEIDPKSGTKRGLIGK